MKRVFFTLVLIFFFLTGCSVFGYSQATPMPQPTMTRLQLPPTWTPTPKLNPTPTVTMIPAATHAATQVVTQTATATKPEPVSPTQTPAAVDLGSLPKLKKAIISRGELENIEGFGSEGNTLRLVTDATGELKESCLWDCAKYVYSLERGVLTIVLLRAGDQEKAQNTVENLKEDFLKNPLYDFTDTANNTIGMPVSLWAVVDEPSATTDYRAASAGTAYGSIVILVHTVKISTATNLVLEECVETI